MVFRWIQGCLAVAMIGLVALGCTGRTTRLRNERSELLGRRQAIQKGEAPQDSQPSSTSTSAKHNSAIDPSLPPEEKVSQIDKRVAEIDAELLGRKTSNGFLP